MILSKAIFAFAWLFIQAFEAQANIAFNKPTNQSSTLENYHSSHAVDGDSTSIDLSGGSCSSTEREDNPWWVVDLGHRRHIQAVVIVSLKYPTLSSYQVGVTNMSPEEEAPRLGGYEVCQRVSERQAAPIKAVNCTTHRGRYVVIQGLKPSYLGLCEVKVYAAPCGPDCIKCMGPGNCAQCKRSISLDNGICQENLALKRPAFQSSTAHDPVGRASMAVDGNLDDQYSRGSCARTNLECGPWWAVDLGAEIYVRKVRVLLAGDEIVGGIFTPMFFFGVSSVSPISQAPKAKETYTPCNIAIDQTIKSPPMFTYCGDNGRYLIIQRIPYPGSRCILCEVEVYGLPCSTLFHPDCVACTDEACTVCASNAPQCVETMSAISYERPNLALYGKAFQSTTKEQKGAELAVDGNHDNAVAYCTLTNINANWHEWWVVDLGTKNLVTLVYIQTRDEKGLLSSLDFAHLSVHDINPATQDPNLKPENYESCYEIRGANHGNPPLTGAKLALPCGQSGRYVMVQVSDQEFLSLCEVQVYGLPCPLLFRSFLTRCVRCTLEECTQCEFTGRCDLNTSLTTTSTTPEPIDGEIWGVGGGGEEEEEGGVGEEGGAREGGGREGGGREGGEATPRRPPLWPDTTTEGFGIGNVGGVTGAAKQLGVAGSPTGVITGAVVAIIIIIMLASGIVLYMYLSKRRSGDVGPEQDLTIIPDDNDHEMTGVE